MPATDRSRLLADLKERIRRIEGVGGADGTALVPLGLPDLDAALPGGGLALGAVHEVVGADARLDGGAATAFAALLLARLAAGRGPVFWIGPAHDRHGHALYPPGLAAYGLAPDRLVLVQADGRGKKGAADILWAMEEALRCPRVGAVIAEVGELDLAASRRLQLAAEAGGVPGLLLRLGPRRMESSACVTRWRLSAAPGEPDGLPGLGDPAWRAELLRVRGGRPGVWRLSWRDGRLAGWRLADAGLEGGPAAPEPGRGVAGAGQGIAPQGVVQLRVARG